MRCDERYYAVRSSCVKCTGVGWPQWLLMALTFVLEQHVELLRLPSIEIMHGQDFRLCTHDMCRTDCMLLRCPGTKVCIGALLAGGFVAVAYFVYAWSPLSWLDGWIKSAARVIFAPEPLGEWQQQLVKRQARSEKRASSKQCQPRNTRNSDEILQ